MNKYYSLIVLCALAWLVNAPASSAQSANQTTLPTDPAITPLSVTGVVTESKPDSRQVIITTAAGNPVAVTLSDRTTFMRIPPGEKTKDKFLKISANDFGLGDSVFARGRMSEDRKAMPALEFYVMSKSDIATKKEHDRNEWRIRGIAGTISALNSDARQITVTVRGSDSPKPLVIVSGDQTQFRRYAPDSVRFADAKSSSFADLKVGDQLRAIGDKNADGTQLTAEEIVSGAFQTIGGTITEVTADKNEIKLSDVQSQQVMTIVINKDSSLRRITPEMLALLMPPKPGATPAQSKDTRDLQEMFEQLPRIDLHDIKPGDAVIVSSTKGSVPSRVTAIALVGGVESLLKNAGGAKGAVSLGAMNLGGP